MVIIYDSVLTEPPSSVHCFRDVTLYSSVFLRKENIMVCPKGMRSMYWNWIKQYGAHDFIKELITEQEIQCGITVGPEGQIRLKILNEYNYGELIKRLQHF
jgi:hypothetical protein